MKIRMSKFNYYVVDDENNLLIYNFLYGIESLIKVDRFATEWFSRLFLENQEGINEDCEELAPVVDKLLNRGVVVYSDTNELEKLRARHYEQSYENKLTLTVLPTGKCMFNCPYCYEEGQNIHREPMSNDASKALLLFIKKNMINFSSLSINWYGGEPLLCTDRILELSDEIIKICNNRRVSYIAEMTTNGFLLDAKTFNLLYKARVYTYMITLDGLMEQHDKIRCTKDGRGSFNTIVKNLLYIRDHKEYKFANIIIRINVSKDVLERLKETVDYITTLFADDKRFHVTFAAVVKYTEKSAYDKFVDPNELFGRLFDNQQFMNRLYDEKDKIVGIIPEQTCLAAKRNAFIVSPNLEIHKCYSYFDNQFNRIGKIDSLGNLLINSSLHQRWYLSNCYLQDLLEKCKKCFYLPCCRLVNPGCPRRYKEKQKWQICEMEKTDFLENINKEIKYVFKTYSSLLLTMNNGKAAFWGDENI